MVLGRGSSAPQELGDDGLTRVTLPLARVKAGGYARVVAAEKDGRRAWTNPVWW